MEMASLVSTRLHYYQNTKNPVDLHEMNDEIGQMELRTKAGYAAAAVAGGLGIVTLAGVLGVAGAIAGALLAISLVSAGYAYCCSRAEEKLSEMKQNWVPVDHKEEGVSSVNEVARQTGVYPSAPPNYEDLDS